jgi:sporulation protein YtfJ
MDIEKTNPIGNLMETTMRNVKDMLQVDTVAGEPITTPDGITLVPISKISMGFGGGGIELGKKRSASQQPYGGGNATGVKVEPTGFLVVKDGVVRMVNVTPPASNTIDRLIDLVPQVMDRIDAFINNTNKEE